MAVKQALMDVTPLRSSPVFRRLWIGRAFSSFGRVAAAEQIVGQAGPDVGNMRGGLVAGVTSGTTALVSGGLLCVAAVVLVGATAPGLRRAIR
ncbi:MAG TPA: hypothetical protein VGD84_13745 [Pseudonocardiaceae bacterium]